MELQILVLSETLQDLQIGKVWTCTVCKVRWVQRADLCFLFSDLKASWQTSQSICLEESSALAVMETKEEMDFLRDESSKYFDIVYYKYHYHQFWIGLEYQNSSSLVLRDGTVLPLQV
uniref:Uncharacterized protein n=1 Tax=Sphaerodactylus townsendi TaxID=933632 RepID=A0ACB8FLS3_9SAUR